MWFEDARKRLAMYGPEIKDGNFGFIVSINTGNGTVEISETDDHDFRFVVHFFHEVNSEVLMDDSFLYTMEIEAAADYAITLYHIAQNDPNALPSMTRRLVSHEGNVLLPD